MVSAPAPLSSHQRVQVVLELKEKGNKALESGNAAQAAEEYTLALLQLQDLTKESSAQDAGTLKAVLLANRSQAYLSQENWDRALEDATSALEIRPDDSKALHRREAALRGGEAAAVARTRGEALKQALFCKSAGNKLLAEGLCEAAVVKYADGLDWLSDISRDDKAVREVFIALLSNRCQALLKQRHWTDALADAEFVLREDPAHAKATYRKARALVELGRNAEAMKVLAALSQDDEDVSSLRRRAAGPPPAKGPPVPRAQPDVVETLVPLKPADEDPSAELRRLLREAESALKKQDPRRALDFARGASGAAQKAKEEAMNQEPPRADPLFRAPPQPPSDGAKEVKQLLAACGLEVRALLALRRFAEASEATRSALKMSSWEAERLERDFDCPDALRSVDGLVESLRHVAEATGALQEAHAAAASRGLRCLEREGWPEIGPLRAALLCRRTAEGSEADARLALSLDPGCLPAQEHLRMLRSG